MKSKKVLNKKNVILFLFPAVPPELFLFKEGHVTFLNCLIFILFFCNCCVTWLLLNELHLSCFCTLLEGRPHLV